MNIHQKTRYLAHMSYVQDIFYIVRSTRCKRNDIYIFMLNK